MEEATGEKREDLEHFQQSRWTKTKKKKVIIGLGVIGDIKAHIPASFLGCESKLDMVTNHHQNPRQELIIVKKQIRNSGRGMQVP